VIFRPPLWAIVVCLVVSLVLAGFARAVVGSALPFLVIWVLVFPMVWCLLVPWLLVWEDRESGSDDFPGY
jgi:hypothetical protein